MIKRTLKRSLSILLTLVLLATTFFIFDPSVLKTDANAWLETTPTSLGSSLATQRAEAPETIYLKPGSITFQYFSNINIDTGTAAASQATTGSVEFSHGGASEVKLYVNNLYKKTDKANNTYTALGSASILNLRSNNSSQGGSNNGITIANVNSGNGGSAGGSISQVATGATLLAGGTTNAVEYTFNNSLCSLNCGEDEVHIIEWVVEYKIGTDYHYSFMYTGVYRPRLQLTGVTGSAQHSGNMGNQPKASGFLFVTGAMNYAAVGNRSHAFIKLESDFAQGAAIRPYLAPLLGFVGQKNNGSQYTVPTVSNGYSSTANFPTSGTKTVMVTGHTSQESSNFLFYTTYTSWGSYANPTGIAGENHADVGRAGMTTAGVYSGIAYEVVDTSRFTDYSQIPNLRVGYVRYSAERGGEYSYLDYIRLQKDSAHYNNASLGVQASFDRSNFDEDGDNARTWGLCTLNGPIQDGNTYISSHYRQDLSGFDRECNVYFGIGFVTKAVNKDAIRKAYSAYLKSNIDKITYSSYESSGFYSKMRTQAQYLCDPTATIDTCGLNVNTVNTVQEGLVEANTADVITFYVPEIIYLTPSTGNMSTFKYYVDRENAANGALRTGEKTTGNIYAKVPGATSVSVACTSGGSASISNASSTSEVKATINSGSVSTALAASGTSLVEWTATYVIDGGTYKTKAYSVAYAPVVDPVSASADGRYDSSYSSRVVKHCITTWIAGLNVITSSHIDGDSDGTGVYKHKPLAGNTIPTGGGQGDILASGSGGSYFYKSDKDAHCGGGCGNVYVDTSRYTNLNQIPNLKIGLDMNNYEGNGTSGKYSKLGYWRIDGTTNETNGGNRDTGALGGNLVKGSNIFTTAMSDTVNTSDNQAYRVQGYNDMKGSGNGSTRNSKAHAYFITVPYNKSALRNALNRELATGKQKEWYTSSSWTAYETALKNAATTLGSPIVSASDFQGLINAIGEKADLLVKNGGTATATHITSSTVPTTYSGSTTFETETKTYKFGDTVEAGSNDYTGYTLKSASRTAPTSATLTPVNDNSTDGKGASDTLTNVTSSSCSWTFTYEPNKYDVTYAPNGGTFNSKTATYPYADIATYDAPFNVGAVTNGGAAAAAPVRTGYDFAGWLCGTNDTTYTNGQSISKWTWATDSVVFTAQWTPKSFNVKYNGNGNTNTPPTGSETIGSFTYEETISVKNETDGKAMYSKTGYTLSGWATKASGGTAIAFGATGVYVSDLVDAQATSSVPNPDPVYVYAQWSINQYYLDLNGTLDGVSGGNISGYGTADVKINGSLVSNSNDVSDFYRQYNYGTQYEVTDIKATEGHYYVGLATGSAALSGTIPASNVSVNLAFNTEQYTITMYQNYDSSDNTVSNTLTGAKYGESKGVVVPQREGYKFLGWYTARSGGTQVYGTTSPITIKDHGANGASITLYAQWEAISISVNYAAGGGSGTNPGSHSFTYGSSVAPKANTFTAPAKRTVTFNANEGSCSTASLDSTFTFNKWKSGANNVLYTAGTAVTDNFGFVYDATAATNTVTLTAQWTQSKITLPTPTRTGYAFLGWYTAAEGGTKVGDAGSQYTPDASKTLYAHWEVGHFSVSLYAYGNSITGTGTWTSGTGGTVSGAATYDYGTSLSAVSASPATGYKFVGWYTAAPTNGTTWGTAITLPSTMPETNKVYYARFDIVYCTVKASAYYNTAASQTTWAAGATGGNVKVTASTSGSEAATSSGKVITGTSASLKATAATGYHFAGWYTSTAVSGTASSTANPLSVAFTSEGATVNKYARFDINTSTLKVNPNGGTWNGFTTEQTYTKAYTQTLSVPVPTRTGYTFAGWTKSSSFYGTLSSTTAAATYTFPANYNVTSTITASWTGISYTITYKYADGTPKSGGNYPASATFGTPFYVSAPTRTGYTFTGWTVTSGLNVGTNNSTVQTAKWGTTSSPATNLTASTTKCVNGAAGDVYFKDLRSTTGAVELTATWLINKYNVTLHAMTEAVNGTFSESTTGGTVSGAGEYDYNSDLSISATANTGYTFAGWFSNSGMTTSASAPTKMDDADVELWAKFTINSYDVSVTAVANTAGAEGTFNAGNASDNSCTATTSAASAKYNTTVTLTAAAGTGYSFAGWYTSPNVSGTAVSTAASYTPAITANMTYYAKFTVNDYTANVYAYNNKTGSYVNNTNGGKVTIEGVSPAVAATAQAASGTLSIGYKGSFKVTAYAATGYTFDGWYTAAPTNGTTWGTTAATATSATFTKTAETQNFYAKFTITQRKLTVYAYSNEGSSPTYSGSDVGNKVAINSGTAGVSVNANLNYDTTATITATAGTGYTFDGWFTNAALTAEATGITEIDNTSATSEAMTDARNYYAKFTAKSFTIKLNANGGAYSGTTGTEISITPVYYNGTVVLNGNPTRIGYDFSGWSTSSTATTATYEPNADLDKEQVNELFPSSGTEKTLYAVWSKLTYTSVVRTASDSGDSKDVYKVNANCGTAVLNSNATVINSVKTIEYGDTILDKITATPATGYVFKEIRFAQVTTTPAPGENVTSWGTTVSGSTTLPKYSNSSTVAYIAYFTVKQYEVDAYAMSGDNAESSSFAQNAAGGTVKVSGGAAGATATANVYFGNTTGVTFEAVANTGYEFKGWYKDSALTVSATSEKVDEAGTQIKVVANSSTVPASGDKIERWAKFTIGKYYAYVRANFYEDGADKVYTVGYDKATGTNGVTGGTASVGIVTDEKTTLGEDAVSVSAKYSESVRYTATAETGYDFIGWYYSENVNDAVDIRTEYAIETAATFEIVMPDEDVRLVAKFVPKNFILVLDPNGGTAGPIAAVTLTYNKPASFDAATVPTKSGSSFLGWAETNTATTPAYTYTDDICSISDVDIVNRWFESSNKTIYAVWQIANYVVTLDIQGATPIESGANKTTTSVNVTLNNGMPAIAAANLPSYEGYKFKGYFTEPGGNGDQYYGLDSSGNAVSLRNWVITDGGTLYALWTCPVVTSADYNETTGKWEYTYETSDGTVKKASNEKVDTPQGLTDFAPADAKEISSIDRTEPNNVVTTNKKAADIDLNDYSQAALTSLLENVKATNTDVKRGAMSQPELNSYVAKVSHSLELAISSNRKESESVKPSIKIYETKSKLNSVKQKTIIDPAKSATGATYEDYPKTTDAASYIYAGKQTETTQQPVDYMIFTNSRTPVIALEIDDGEVGTSVDTNTASYPTKVNVETNDFNTSIVKGTAASDGKTYTTGAVEATNNISEAWFKSYVDAGIGVGDGTEASKKAHDYNAKTILYLTPEFISDRIESTKDEIIYTITPTDDAYVENAGVTQASIADVPTAQASKYRAFSEDNKPTDTESITICVSYHNAMNGTSDEGGSGGYLQLDRDQPTNANRYGDLWLNQVHLFRTAGGVANWELPQINEEVYPVDDMTYRNTGYVFGSFAYVFDATNEAVAASYAEAGNYTAAKEAIIESIKNTASEKIAALNDQNHAEHLKHAGLGLFQITGWSTNYYPKKDSYVYAHLVDRWGNVFNRVWKNFNWEDIKVAISGNVTNGFKLDEKGGSNIDYITLDGANIDFVTDLDSDYENDVFTTTENAFIVMTDKPASKIPMKVYDHAGNVLSGKIPTNLDGSIKFTVTDECADLSRGAYTFDINESEVNLWAREPALVRKTEMVSTSISGEPTVFTITTMDRAKKVQLVENGMTRTYTPDMSNVEVVDNGDGTMSWTIRVNPLTLGEHTFEVKCKDNTGWHDTDTALTTTVISKPAVKPDLKLSVEDAICEVGERPVLRVSTIKGTEFVRVIYDNGYSTTVSRSDNAIVSCVDDIEVWSISAGTFKATGEYTASVFIQYNGKWQRDNTVTCTITVKEPVKQSSKIFSVTVLDKEVNAGEKATIEVLTNKDTNKLQFVLSNDTYTVTASNAEIRENGDGTLTWTIEKSFSTIGVNDIILKSKSSAGWTEAAVYDTVTVS